MKKDEMRFSIRFNPADPRHRKAALLLNMAGRRKAAIVADAIWEYEMKYAVSASDTKKPGNGRSETEMSRNDCGRCEIERNQDIYVTHIGSEDDDMLRDSILDAIGRFQDD